MRRRYTVTEGDTLLPSLAVTLVAGARQNHVGCRSLVRARMSKLFWEAGQLARGQQGSLGAAHALADPQLL